MSVQAQILALLRELIAERSMALALVTHDMGVIAALADDVRGDARRQRRGAGRRCADPAAARRSTTTRARCWRRRRDSMSRARAARARRIAPGAAARP